MALKRPSRASPRRREVDRSDEEHGAGDRMPSTREWQVEEDRVA